LIAAHSKTVRAEPSCLHGHSASSGAELSSRRTISGRRTPRMASRSRARERMADDHPHGSPSAALRPPPASGSRPTHGDVTIATDLGDPLDYLREWNLVAGSTGLEPAASGVTGRRSNQLNYDPAKTFKRTTLRTSAATTSAGNLVRSTGSMCEHRAVVGPPRDPRRSRRAL
jgi:hypothetical protein